MGNICDRWDATSKDRGTYESRFNPKKTERNKCTKKNPGGTWDNFVHKIDKENFAGLTPDNTAGRPSGGYAAVDFCNFIGDLDENGDPEWATSVGSSKLVQFEEDLAYRTELKKGYSWTTHWDKERRISNPSTDTPNANFGISVNDSNEDCKQHFVYGVYEAACIRMSYSANPVVCCFKDMACDEGDEDKCFQTPERQRTCSPDYRNLNSNLCRDKIYDYCVGDKLFKDQANWKDIWKDQPININSDMKYEKYDDDSDYDKLYYSADVKSPYKKQVNSRRNFYSVFRPYSKYKKNRVKMDKPIIDSLNERQDGTIDRDFFLKNREFNDGILNLSAVGSEPSTRGQKYPVIQRRPCFRAIVRSLTDAKICSEEELDNTLILEANTNADGFAWSANLMEKVFNKFINEDAGGDFFSNSGDQSFKESLFEICSKIPSVCVSSLEKVCENETVQDLLTDPEKKKWCGCYLSEDQFRGGVNDFISKECRSTCVGQNSIPVIGSNGVPITCIQSICTITDADVEFYSSTGEEVTFSQLCPGCGESSVRYELQDGFRFINQWNKEEDKIFNVGDNTWDVFLESTETIGFLDTELPTARITVVNNILTDVVILSRGTEKFNDQVSRNGEITGDISLYISRYFEKTFNDINLPIITTKSFFESTGGADASITLSFSTSPYSKRVIQGDGQYEENNYRGYEFERKINRCTCTMENVDVTAINSRIKGNINIENNCGSFDCFDSEGKPVTCEDKTIRIPDLEEVLSERYVAESKKRYSNISYILLGTLVFISLFFFIFFTIYKIFDISFKKKKITQNLK